MHTFHQSFDIKIVGPTLQVRKLRLRDQGKKMLSETVFSFLVLYCFCPFGSTLSVMA